MERGPVTVACNLAARTQSVPVGRERPTEVLLSSHATLEVSVSGVVLPADSVVILGPAGP